MFRLRAIAYRLQFSFLRDTMSLSSNRLPFSSCINDVEVKSYLPLRCRRVSRLHHTVLNQLKQTVCSAILQRRRHHPSLLSEALTPAVVDERTLVVNRVTKHPSSAVTLLPSSLTDQ